MASAEAKGPKQRVDRRSSVGGVTAIDGGPEVPATRAGLDGFLAAGYLAIHADPEFKERLRKDLWNLVKNRYGAGPFSSS